MFAEARDVSPEAGVAGSSTLFPGAVGLTHLRVYDSMAPDGLVGGSPHLHLASAEAYVVTAGTGSVQLLSASGYRTVLLAPGEVVWFEPGVVHRLINDGNLEILCVMANSGLPEAGDAVLTFPPGVMADDEAYRHAASLAGAEVHDREAAAAQRRDLAVAGFGKLLIAYDRDGVAALRTFLETAVARKREVLPAWERIVEMGPVLDANRTAQRLAALHDGRLDELTAARAWSTGTDGDHTGVGMCGRLDAFQPEGVVI